MATKDNQMLVTEPERIKCLMCGRWFRALPTHIRRGHGISERDYRDTHSIPMSTPLVSGNWSKRAREVGKEDRVRASLNTGKQRSGYQQTATTRRLRRKEYESLAEIGTRAAAEIDKTADRRKRLEPYPVTVEQAMDRLGISMSATYTFLARCVERGKLRRIRRGLYGPIG